MADGPPRCRTTTPSMHRCQDGRRDPSVQNYNSRHAPLPRWPTRPFSAELQLPACPAAKMADETPSAQNYNSRHAPRESGNGGNSAPWRSGVAAALPASRMRAAPLLWRVEA
ncbi:uncharacterized protein ACIBXB_004192 [Morphnus guianensis]